MCTSDIKKLIKTVVPNSIGRHIVIHEHMLDAKILPSGLKQIMPLVSQAVNFIKLITIN
jgi:hypothetical protein